ncbi:2-C-methyl-D-erythritol 2,4-cyclodiphosphate synthase [Desulfuribacillus alkaliarsenatis]|uniref:2-C-methyl-D-erythritol 2,4-cyclodiphosphate synthase n=1 Tax=Desulfuribacillus alkaliarsenatis TaxID=766136 RepID=A0A1E5G4E6_9FIRM|nr:2-C-methyl-D-erythritol 2,4-cyclodiphosphate synthase [Desulfuribacillus alkaliarsenatis]OEF97962.1 2-C-methyl-D-erythritol 2,4-cyclodiphosphate synthase [Desulfuribacillus alkaliarsenatis]
MRIGIGYDVHRFADNRELIIGGVKIEHKQGLLGHSDADVLLHAIKDAILGALALGDIGKHFPDTDEKYKGISSVKLLEHVWELVESKGYQMGNLDSIIIAEKPKMAPHIEAMREIIAKACRCEIGQVGVKATTTERLGFTGREEGIAAQAVVMLEKNC